MRTIRGGLQAAIQCPWMFSRRFWPAGFHYLSWKVSKHLVPVWAILFTLSAIWLSATTPALRFVLGFELFAVVLIIASGAIRKLTRGLTFRASSAVWYLFVANLAALVAVFQTLFGDKQTGIWAAAPRATANASTDSPSPGAEGQLTKL